MRAALIEREFASAEHPFLRYQAGIAEKRLIQNPICSAEGKEVLRYEDGEERVSVFHLLGFGASPQTAKARALARLRAQATSVQIEPS